MKNAGYAHMGVGGATGSDKAELAARAAISSPLLETSIHGARGILISITASHDVGLEEVDLASSMISREAHPDANVIWGLAFDEALDDEMRITIIATGFENQEQAVAAPVAEAAPAPEVVAPAMPEQPAIPAQPAAPVQPTVPVVEPVASHAPKYDSEGEDSSISEDDFDNIMSIFRNRSRRNRGDY